ncbi:MAG: alginate lyase family protein [Chloroflexi bacterium]|nr:alginate lyase family protein [Chloroflexota bacterium]
MPKFHLALKAFRQLNPKQLGLYALYQIYLRSGYLRWKTRSKPPLNAEFHPIFNFPDSTELISMLGVQDLNHVVEIADEIVAGQVRLFGGAPVPMILAPPGELVHWTAYERGDQVWGVEDVKFTWEPARFGWVFSLGHAYWLTKDERYPEAFWGYVETFWEANPVNFGPNWSSAQEVALRLMALTFAAQIFADSHHTTRDQIARLTQSIAEHAARIPASLIYARAQNNNHLLSEAAGLITASLVLPNHPDAHRWEKLGSRWFEWGIEHQISEDGAYLQNSANYHRLMLGLALWIHAAADRKMSPVAYTRLASAVRWLLTLCDSQTGRVPNLGPNDGAYIFPLTALPYQDYRPVLGAASLAFLGKPAFEPGSWDELGLWFSGRTSSAVVDTDLPLKGPAVLRNHVSDSWIYLRAEQLTSRPGHADQLHLDLWWRGHNLAIDAGTYRYTALPPWDNALTHSAVHNTITVAGREQMTRAGRFLYLDWAQARIVEQTENSVVAEHDGYRHLDLTHRRKVNARSDGSWIVEDTLFSNSNRGSSFPSRLHWLLPDWIWQIDDTGLVLKVLSPDDWVTLEISVDTQSRTRVLQSSIVRAGKLLQGRGTVSPTQGWMSPTYGQKVPALSFAVDVEGSFPLKLISTWSFPND